MTPACAGLPVCSGSGDAGNPPHRRRIDDAVPDASGFGAPGTGDATGVPVAMVATIPKGHSLGGKRIRGRARYVRDKIRENVPKKVPF